MHAVISGSIRMVKYCTAVDLHGKHDMPVSDQRDEQEKKQGGTSKSPTSNQSGGTCCWAKRYDQRGFRRTKHIAGVCGSRQPRGSGRWTMLTHRAGDLMYVDIL